MTRLRSQSGFTLPELLVVIIIVGVLAALALPTFLGRVKQGNDAATKSDVSSLAGMVEACHVESEDYRACDTESEFADGPGRSGLPVGLAQGQVLVEVAGVSSFRAVGWSQSGTRFSIERTSVNNVLRECDNHGHGACPPDGTW